MKQALTLNLTLGYINLNDMEETIKLLEKIVKIVDESEAWWMGCPDKGGIDTQEIDDHIKKLKGQSKELPLIYNGGEIKPAADGK